MPDEGAPPGRAGGASSSPLDDARDLVSRLAGGSLSLERGGRYAKLVKGELEVLFVARPRACVVVRRDPGNVRPTELFPTLAIAQHNLAKHGLAAAPHDDDTRTAQQRYSVMRCNLRRRQQRP